MFLEEMAAVKCPEPPVQDNYIVALGDLLDQCSDELISRVVPSTAISLVKKFGGIPENYIGRNAVELAELLKGSPDDYKDYVIRGKGDGCERCSCAGECCDIWERIEPKRHNRLSSFEAVALMREFSMLRLRRQLRLPLK
ncbi:MAG: hypothetical protein ACRKGH_09625 [Dehalogenimonas sp.]